MPGHGNGSGIRRKDMYKTTVRIDGMACGMCEAHINDAIRKALPQAKKVASSHAKGEASFLTEFEIDNGMIREIIDNTGYTFVSSASAPYEKKGLFGKIFSR